MDFNPEFGYTFAKQLKGASQGRTERVNLAFLLLTAI
jgi:hypothetical protein